MSLEETNNTTLWVFEPKELFNNGSWKSFWPWVNNYSDQQIMNATSRLVLYSSIISALLQQDATPLVIGPMVLLIGIFVYISSRKSPPVSKPTGIASNTPSVSSSRVVTPLKQKEVLNPLEQMETIPPGLVLKSAKSVFCGEAGELMTNMVKKFEEMPVLLGEVPVNVQGENKK